MCLFLAVTYHENSLNLDRYAWCQGTASARQIQEVLTTLMRVTSEAPLHIDRF
jgi:hypothetical protein